MPKSSANGPRCDPIPGKEEAKEFPANWRSLVESETPRGCAGAPEDIAETLLFLASDAARNITGQTLAADGGMSIHVPGFAELSKAFSD